MRHLFVKGVEDERHRAGQRDHDELAVDHALVRVDGQAGRRLHHSHGTATLGVPEVGVGSPEV